MIPMLGGGEAMLFRVPGFAADDNVDVAANTTVEFDVLANDALIDDLVDLTVADSTNGITPVVLRNSSEVCTPEPNGSPPPDFLPDPDCFPAPQAEFTIEYTSAPGFNGTDTFVYTITDDVGPVETATVTVSNQLPAAVDDTAGTPVDTNVIIDVLAQRHARRCARFDGRCHGGPDQRHDHDDAAGDLCAASHQLFADLCAERRLRRLRQFRLHADRR